MSKKIGLKPVYLGRAFWYTRGNVRVRGAVVQGPRISTGVSIDLPKDHPDVLAAVARIETEFVREQLEHVDDLTVDPPYCDHGCGDLATVRMLHVGLCDDCAADTLRRQLVPLIGRACCNISRDSEGNLTMCLTRHGITHLHG